MTNRRSENDKEEIISYHQLRTFIGIIGVCLPFALVIGCYLFGAADYAWQHSISHYYYSDMHIVFICTLCVLGGFLITYRGKPDNPWESRVSNFAGYCAFGVAAFPTQFQGFRPPTDGRNQYIAVCAIFLMCGEVFISPLRVHCLSASLSSAFIFFKRLIMIILQHRK